VNCFALVLRTTRSRMLHYRLRRFKYQNATNPVRDLSSVAGRSEPSNRYAECGDRPARTSRL